MSDITIDPRDEFEKVFPIPMYVIRCGKGYACTEYNAWGAHNFIRQWEGWGAAMLHSLLQGSQPVSNRDELPESEIECDICGFKSTDLDGAHYCCEDNSDD